MDYITTNNELTYLADTIRSAASTNDTLSFPSGFIAKINMMSRNVLSNQATIINQYISGTLSGRYIHSASSIRPYAFANLSIDYYANKNLSIVPSGAFYECTHLQEVYIPSCTNIATSAFYKCAELKSINFQSISYIGAYAFRSCQQLDEVIAPNCTTLYTQAFSDCTALVKAIMPSCVEVMGYAFYNCSNLSIASFSNLFAIYVSAFYGCNNLLSLYLIGSSIVSLYSTASAVFYSTPIYGYTESTGGIYGSIYVPASLLSDYQTANNWSAISERFVGLTNSEIAAL